MASNRLKTFSLTGGEDFVTPALDIPDGMARIAFNYEQNYDTGYTRISGYRKLVNDTTPGEGPILGVVVYNDDIYIFRNHVGGLTAGMWKATPAEYDDSVSPATIISNGSWTEITDIVDNSDVATTLDPDGYYEFVIHNFKATASTTTVAAAGSHDVSGNIGNLYGVDGVNPAFEFNGTQLKQIDSTYTPDVPQHIEANGNRLALGFRAGEVAMSVLGDPHDFDPVNGAGSVGVTDFLTGMLAGPDGVMYIFTKDKCYVLYGMQGALAQAEMKKHSKDVGAYPYTEKMLAGKAMFFDTWGITELAATDTFGDVATNSISRKVQNLFQGNQPQTSVVLREKAQYRLYFYANEGSVDTTTCLIATLIQGESLGFTHASYPFRVFSMGSGEITMGDETEEVNIAGSDDGEVYQMDKGNSFDGAEYTSYLTLPFNYLGSPHRIKKVRKIMMNIDALDYVQIQGAVDFSFGQRGQPKDVGQDVVNPAGNRWGLGVWNDFYWGTGYTDYVETYINGHGENVSVTISSTSATDRPHTLKDITFIYQYQRIDH